MTEIPVPSPGGSTTEGQVMRALGSIGAATLLSRVLGFARDMIVALIFGAGTTTDAFFVAFRIPNVLRRLLAEGALSTAAIPVFSEYLVNRSRDEFLRMLRAVFAAMLIVLTVVTLVGIVLTPWLLRVIAPGFTEDPARETLAVLLTRVMFPYLLLVGVAALAMGALNVEGRFFASALGPAALNVGMIAGVVAFARVVDPPILSLAFGVLAGGAGQILVQVPSLGKAGFLVAPSVERHPALRRIVRLLLPSIFGLAAVQVTVFVNTLLASLLPAGAISFLYYADRVMEFPLGIFGIALASASLPAMSRQAAVGDLRGVANTLNFALRLSFFVAVPATVGLVLLREPITRVLFERGRFSPDDTVATAAALAAYAAGLAGFAGARIAAQAFYAIGEAGVAVRVGIVSVVVNVFIALALMGPMQHAGLALASSLAAWLNLLILVVIARRRFGPIGGRSLGVSVVRTLGASATVVALCLVMLGLRPHRAGAVHEAMWLAVTIAGGGAAYWGTTILLRAPERLALIRMLPWPRTRSGREATGP